MSTKVGMKFSRQGSEGIVPLPWLQATGYGAEGEASEGEEDEKGKREIRKRRREKNDKEEGEGRRSRVSSNENCRRVGGSRAAPMRPVRGSQLAELVAVAAGD